MVRLHFRLPLILLGSVSLALVACDSGDGEDSEDTSQGGMEIGTEEGQMPGMVMPELPDDLDGFHSAGVPDSNELEPDVGRFTGVTEVVVNEFNCLGTYSDADPDHSTELRIVKTEGLELLGAFKVPTLRNVAETAPYMHAGQFETRRKYWPTTIAPIRTPRVTVTCSLLDSLMKNQNS